MSKYDEIVSEEMGLEEKLRKLKSDKAKLENDIYMTFGKIYMNRRELKIEDFIGVEKEKQEEVINNIVNDDMNFDSENINYNHNNEK